MLQDLDQQSRDVELQLESSPQRDMPFVQMSFVQHRFEIKQPMRFSLGNSTHA